MPQKANTTHELNRIRDGISGDTTHMAVGTDTGEPTQADTSLGNEVLEKASSPEDGSDGEVRHVMRLSTAEANGETLTEVGEKDGASGNLNRRIVHAGIDKDSGFELEYRIKKTVQNPT